MKKLLLKSLAVIYAFAFCNTSAFASDPDFENDYTLVKSATFGGAEATNIAGSVACDYTAYDTGNKKQQTLTVATAPSDAAGWIAFQAWTDGSGKGWWNRANNSLYCVNAGRSAAVFGSDLTIGWIVVFECKNQASTCMTLVNGNGDPDGTFSYVTSEDGKSYFCTINAKENAYVGFCGNKNAQGITKISVYKPNKVVVPTTYKVAYIDDDNTILKDTVTYNGIAGVSVSVTDADKANIVYDGYTYLYDSDDSEGMSVAEDGSTVLTVKFRKAENFSYTVNEVCGTTNVRTTEGTSYETSTVTVPYRLYNVLDGVLYKKGATSKEYNYSFKLNTDDTVENLAYESAGVENVVFLSEGEDINGLTKCTSANTAIRSSNSSSAYPTEDTNITTLPAGKYKMHIGMYDAAKTPASTWDFFTLVDEDTVKVATFNCNTTNIQEATSDEFTITNPSGSDIYVKQNGNDNVGIDFLYIQKTGEYNYFNVNDSDLSDTITVKYGEDEFPDLCNDYVSVETNAMSVSKKLGLAKVLAGIDKKEVEYNMLGSMDEVVAFTTQSGPGIYYAFVNIEAQFDEKTDSSYVSDTIVINVVEGNHLIINSWLPDTITYTKGDPDMPQLSDYYTYESSQKDESKFTATMGLVKVEPGTAKDAVEYNIYDNEMAVKLAFVQGGVGTYYAFGKVTVEYDDQTTETVTTDTIVIEIKEKEAEPIVSTHTWDFTQFSETTVNNMKAEAALVEIEDKGEGKTNVVNNNGATWSDHEKAAQTDASKYNTTYAASKDNCFWFYGSANADGELEANGQVIDEFKGLVFHNNAYNTARSLAVAVNYGATSLGTYNGPSYLWLGGKGKECFTIKNVKAGTTITMGVESHKIAEARGVKLLVDGLELMGEDGNSVAAPTVYTEQTWVVPIKVEPLGAKGSALSTNADEEQLVDVVVSNTNGCHIYYIDAEIGEPTPDAIEAVSEDASNAGAKKIFENGKIVILNGATKYNTAGAQVK